MSELMNLPPQQLPFYKKNRKWRKQHLDWADSKTFFNYSPVRKSVIHKKINYDLVNGKLHMSDMELIFNPEKVKADCIPDRIQHYPILNSKLNVLRGEESKRPFDFKVIVTNPNSISNNERIKKEKLFESMRDLISDTSNSDEEFNRKMEELSYYYSYEWQDTKEILANCLCNHYIKEYNIPLIFNEGYMDALTVGEEVYQCDIVGGEPVLNRIDPLKLRVFKSGYSNKIEDADIIIIEDYWSPGKIIDTYYDVLSEKDMKYIASVPDHMSQASVDSMDNIDERYGFVNNYMVGDEVSTDGFYFDPFNLFSDSSSNSLLPYDLAGNLRVLRMYWKSRRRIKKVKSYDPVSGEEVYNFYPETYIINKDAGEEEEIFYVNEAWEGTKIGTDIYVNMRPRIVQYNRLSNPSRCHFGIIGTIYNINNSRPFSMVDMMKSYNYMYDMIHDRLNKMIARNWGKIITLDLSKVPKNWSIEKWYHFARVNGLAVIDSFNEGNIGASTGKLAGALNNASSGVIDAEVGNSIQMLINLLEFIKMEMSEAAGITRQREGQISNRETVGGVERATLQSSHITEWLFFQHDDLKRRVLECLLETAKIAYRGRSKKFQYILSDGAQKVLKIDGNEFAESDYGIVVDNSNEIRELSQKLDSLAQAALQNSSLSFSTIMKLYRSGSLAEKQRFIERDEKNTQERAMQAQQQQVEAEQQKVQMEIAQREAELQQKEQANIRDNETRLMIAQMQADSLNDGIKEGFTEKEKEELRQRIKEFSDKMNLEKDKFEFEKEKYREDSKLKEKEIMYRYKTKNKK